MAIYKRDVTDEEDDINPTVEPCLTLNLEFVAVTHACPAEITLCGDDDFTIGNNGEIIIMRDIFLTTSDNPACYTFLMNNRLKIPMGTNLALFKLPNFAFWTATIEVRI